MAIKLVVDSTADITPEYAKENDIRVVSLNISTPDEEIKETDIKNVQQYYKRMAEDNNFVVKTSQPSIAEFEEAITEALDGNKNEVLVLTMGSSLSGTYSCACLAADNAGGGRAAVIDSGTATLGFRLFIEEVIALIKQGKTVKQIIAAAPDITKRIHVYFVPSSLKFLHRGGRMSTISAAIGSILQIKPIIHFHDNVMQCAKKVIGFTKALTEMVSLIPAKIKQLILASVAGGANIGILKKLLADRNLKTDYEKDDITMVIAAHAGPGAVGVVFIE